MSVRPVNAAARRSRLVVETRDGFVAPRHHLAMPDGFVRRRVATARPGEILLLRMRRLAVASSVPMDPDAAMEAFAFPDESRLPVYELHPASGLLRAVGRRASVLIPPGLAPSPTGLSACVRRLYGGRERMEAIG